MPILPSFPLRRTGALLGAWLVLAGAAVAADQPVRDYGPSDETAEVFPKYRTAAEAKDYNTALAILDAQLAKVKPDSYDAALIYQVKAQTLLQKGDFSASISPIEKGIALSDSKTPTYYEERVTRELVYFLASLYLQEAVQSKVPAVAAGFYAKGVRAMERWVKLAPASTPEAQLIYAQLLYNWAVQDQEHVNKDLIKRALDQVEVGLHLAVHPKDTLYVFKMACLQQLDRVDDLTDTLELIVTLKPDSANYWQQLAGYYLQSERPLRAALTIERAQAHGHMAAPKDTFNLIGIYYNLGQFEKVAELLSTGLQTGRVDNEIKNWELLAGAYQQLDRPFKSIDALQQATKAFPKSGHLEFLIAQAYNALDQPEQALPHLQAAIAKGDLPKPHQVYLFLAYVGFQLKKYDIALDAAKHAAEFPEGAKDGKNMIKAIEDVLKEREAKKNQA
ncbi:MAG TPA: tetratricopeptide repeat protein [Lacunisphaera sp.]|nr:tetratricopeptide repeat protein [Lacunisphaera sp.]